MDDELQTGQQHLMELKLDNARDLYPVVKALMFRENGAVDISENGLRIIVDDQNCLQAIAYVKAEIFSHYVLQTQAVTFRISIGVLAECLNVFGVSSNTALKMTYDGHGEPLKVLLEKDGIVVKCVIKTQNPDVVLDFDFDSTSTPAKVIMKPQKLKEAFQELDSSSPTVGFRINRRFISISTEGDLGRIKTEFPHHSEQIERLECVDEVEHKYRSSLVKRMTPSLNLCNKVSLRIDDRGVLSVQFMIEHSNNNHIFIEFFCVPDADVFSEENGIND